MKNTNRETARELETLFNKAIELHHNDQLVDACLCYQQILEVMPGSSLVNYNLGLALFELGNFNESLQCYSEALRQAPEEQDLLYNYALCCQKLTKYDKAIRTYTKLLSVSPADVDALYNLACCYMDSGKEEQAQKKFLEVLKINPEHIPSLNNLGCLLHKNGELSQAEDYYTRLLQLQPDHQSAKHLLASILGYTTDKAPAHYVEGIFDSYSSHYDESLSQKLAYRLPKTARQHFDAIFKIEPDSLNTLDLGCGTGLSGMAFVDVSSKLTGIDLSRNMIERAKQKKIYNNLFVNEIETYLDSCSDSYDLVLAFDIFPYIGKLSSTFQKILSVSSKKCLFCFSIEKSSCYPFKLQNTGRYAHSHPYIQETCTEAGWSVDSANDINLRKEKGKWLEGILYFASPA